MSALLKEISNWKLEAKHEDNSRYFYHTSEVDDTTKSIYYNLEIYYLHGHMQDDEPQWQYRFSGARQIGKTVSFRSGETIIEAHFSVDWAVLRS